jgi:hypothetical protein
MRGTGVWGVWYKRLRGTELQRALANTVEGDGALGVVMMVVTVV